MFTSHLSYWFSEKLHYFVFTVNKNSPLWHIFCHNLPMKNKNILSKKWNKFQLLAVCRFRLYPEKTRKSFLPGPIWTHIWWWWWWRGGVGGCARTRIYMVQWSCKFNFYRNKRDPTFAFCVQIWSHYSLKIAEIKTNKYSPNVIPKYVKPKALSLSSILGKIGFLFSSLGSFCCTNGPSDKVQTIKTVKSRTSLSKAPCQGLTNDQKSLVVAHLNFRYSRFFAVFYFFNPVFQPWTHFGRPHP